MVRQGGAEESAIALERGQNLVRQAAHPRVGGVGLLVFLDLAGLDTGGQLPVQPRRRLQLPAKSREPVGREDRRDFDQHQKESAVLNLKVRPAPGTIWFSATEL